MLAPVAMFDVEDEAMLFHHWKRLVPQDSRRTSDEVEQERMTSPSAVVLDSVGQLTGREDKLRERERE